MANGKCPKCEKNIHRIKLETVDASAGLSSTTWKCVNYLCPHCFTVLSCQIDPIAIKTDTVREIKSR